MVLSLKNKQYLPLVMPMKDFLKKNGIERVYRRVYRVTLKRDLKKSLLRLY